MPPLTPDHRATLSRHAQADRSSSSDPGAAVPSRGSTRPTAITGPFVDPTSELLDLGMLPVEEQAAIVRRNAEEQIRLQTQKARMQQDLQALHFKLNTIVDAAARATEAGVATTVTNTTDDSTGHTEVIAGNSDNARAGKLSMTQSGRWQSMSSRVTVIVVVAIVTTGLVLIAAAALGN